MGARAFMRRRMAEILPERLSYDYVGRQLRAAPGRGLLGRAQARAGTHRARGARLREGPTGARQLGPAAVDVKNPAAAADSLRNGSGCAPAQGLGARRTRVRRGCNRDRGRDRDRLGARRRRPDQHRPLAPRGDVEHRADVRRRRHRPGGLAPAGPRVRLRRLRVRARVRHPGRGGHRRRPRGGQPARDRLRGDGPSGPPLHAHGRGVRAARRLPARALVAHAARRLHRRRARRRRRGVGRARGRGLPGRRRLPARPFQRTRHVGPHRRRAHLRARRDLRAASARAAGRLVRLRRPGRGRRAQPDGARTGRAVRGRWRSRRRARRPASTASASRCR